MGLLDDFSTLSDSAKQYALDKLAQFGNGVGNTVQAIPANANRLAQGLLNLPQQATNEVGQLFSPQTANKLAGLLAQPQKANPQQWMDQGMALAGMAPVMGLLGHTVYHGSPHKFDKFDMSKIGTGEGAQAYGHGLYFAEAPEVANAYKETLEKGSGNWSFKTGLGETGTSGDAFQAADIAHMMQEYGPVDKDWLGRELGARGLHPNMAKTVKKYLDAGPIERVKGGALYKVDIPDESIPRMLDWDKPLSQQHPDVQSAIENLKPNMSAAWQKALNPKTSGQSLHIAVASGTNRANDAASLLQQQGIPGIRYLDGSSRGTGQGTSNYVLFDDQLPRILEVNGQPTGLKPWNAK